MVHLMDAVIFFILSASIFPYLEASYAVCKAVKCGYGAPDIRFPFRAQGLQLQRCGYPGFELVCRENTTLIQFAGYGDLVVKSISYDLNILELLDPKNCVHEVFLNLNLSQTPFNYYYVLKNYTYIKCSAALQPPFTRVPCLSSPGHHVYTVEASLHMPGSCRAIKTTAIPFSYSPYLSDNSFGLALTWDLPEFKDPEAKGNRHGFHYSKAGHETENKGFPSIYLVMVLCIGIFIVTAAMLISMRLYHSNKQIGQKRKEEILKVEKLRGDYKLLHPIRQG